MDPQYLELLFPEKIAPGDLEILEPPGMYTPGRARLLAAKIETANEHGSRVLSTNGGALIGILCKQVQPPLFETYTLEHDNGH